VSSKLAGVLGQGGSEMACVYPFYHVEALSQIDAIQLLVDASDQVMPIIEKPYITGNGYNAKKVLIVLICATGFLLAVRKKV
jgi:hypothetical protein